MFAIIRTATDAYGTGRVVILSHDELAAYHLAATEIKSVWMANISIANAQDYEHNGEFIVAEHHSELEGLRNLEGRDLVEAWNVSPLNNPNEFDTEWQITYESAVIIIDSVG